MQERAHLCTWSHPRCKTACTDTCCSPCRQHWWSSLGNTLAAELWERQNTWDEDAIYIAMPLFHAERKALKPVLLTGKPEDFFFNCLALGWYLPSHSAKSLHRGGKHLCSHFTKEETGRWRDMFRVQSKSRALRPPVRASGIVNPSSLFSMQTLCWIMSAINPWLYTTQSGERRQRPSLVSQSRPVHPASQKHCPVPEYPSSHCPVVLHLQAAKGTQRDHLQSYLWERGKSFPRTTLPRLSVWIQYYLTII